MEGAVRALKNLRPALGVICANMMFLEKTPCPSGVNKVDAEAVAKQVDDMLMTLLNHPSTKSALGSILKRMLLDLGRHQVTTKRILTGIKTRCLVLLLLCKNFRCYHGDNTN